MHGQSDECVLPAPVECLVDIFAIAITKRPCGAVDDEVMWLICLLDAARRRCSHVGILIHSDRHTCTCGIQCSVYQKLSFYNPHYCVRKQRGYATNCGSRGSVILLSSH